MNLEKREFGGGKGDGTAIKMEAGTQEDGWGEEGAVQREEDCRMRKSVCRERSEMVDFVLAFFSSSSSFHALFGSRPVFDGWYTRE